MICLGQGGLRSLSASSCYRAVLQYKIPDFQTATKYRLPHVPEQFHSSVMTHSAGSRHFHA